MDAIDQRVVDRHDAIPSDLRAHDKFTRTLIVIHDEHIAALICDAKTDGGKALREAGFTAIADALGLSG